MSSINITASVFGYVSLILAIVTICPQAYTTYKTKETSGLSLWMYILYVIGSILWVIWCCGYFVEEINNQNVPGWQTIIIQVPAFIINILGVIVCGYVVFAKMYNMQLAKKLNIPERDVAQYRLNKKKAGAK